MPTYAHKSKNRLDIALCSAKVSIESANTRALIDSIGPLYSGIQSLSLYMWSFHDINFLRCGTNYLNWHKNLLIKELLLKTDIL